MTPKYLGNITKARCTLHAFVRNKNGFQPIFFNESRFGSIEGTGTTGNFR
jgi:hypothetical protein